MRSQGLLEERYSMPQKKRRRKKSLTAYSEHTHIPHPFCVNINMEEGHFKHSQMPQWWINVSSCFVMLNQLTTGGKTASTALQLTSLMANLRAIYPLGWDLHFKSPKFSQNWNIALISQLISLSIGLLRPKHSMSTSLRSRGKVQRKYKLTVAIWTALGKQIRSGPLHAPLSISPSLAESGVFSNKHLLLRLAPACCSEWVQHGSSDTLIDKSCRKHMGQEAGFPPHTKVWRTAA